MTKMGLNYKNGIGLQKSESDNKNGMEQIQINLAQPNVVTLNLFQGLEYFQEPVEIL